MQYIPMPPSPTSTTSNIFGFTYELFSKFYLIKHLEIISLVGDNRAAFNISTFL